MKLLMFAVFDAAVNAYMPPMFFRARGEALRAFTDAVNKSGDNLNKFSSDYTFMYLGEYDDAGGVFNSVAPQRVISATECLLDDPFKPETRQQ